MGGTEKEYTVLVVQKGILNKVLLSWLLGRSLPVRTFPEVPPPPPEINKQLNEQSAPK